MALNLYEKWASAVPLGDRPTYTDKYSSKMEDLYKQISGRGPFQYDTAKDPLFQGYKDQYMAAGKLAMKDTMGQAAALTGGYANTYGQQVGQQAYDAYLQHLGDVIPSLYGMAMDQYKMQGDQMLQQYSMLGDMRDRDYGMYRDALGDWENTRNFLVSLQEGDYNRQFQEDQFNYQKSQDAWNNSFRQQQFNYQKEQDAYNNQFRQSQFDYQKSQDAYARQLQEEQIAYQKMLDAYNRQWNEENRDYQRQQDAYERAWNEENRDYQRKWNEEERSYNREQDEYDKQWNRENRDYDRAWNEENRDYTRAWNEENRDYERLIYEDEKSYNRSQDAYGNLYSLIAGSGYSPSDAELAAAGMSRQAADALSAEYQRNVALDNNSNGWVYGDGWGTAPDGTTYVGPAYGFGSSGSGKSSGKSSGSSGGGYSAPSVYEPYYSDYTRQDVTDAYNYRDENGRMYSFEDIYQDINENVKDKNKRIDLLQWLRYENQ
ncbi:MAG: hypothetical protein IJI06_08910 [Oscillospiraceae bacterium]|nr:hypothetical protein [Oscillospiraceae bacterium]